MRLGISAALMAGAMLAQPVTNAGETARLLFRSAPPRGGTMEKQVEGGIKELKKAGSLVKVRAFVTADTSSMAVAAAIQRALGAKSKAVVSTVHIARLPGGAPVLLEGVVSSKRVENPNGLAFISGQLAQAAAGALTPLMERPLASLKTIAAGLDANPEDIVRVNCYASSVDDEPQMRSAVTKVFPKADVSIMQIQRAPANQFVECDAIARLGGKPAGAVRLLNPTQAAFAQAAIVTAPRILFTAAFPGTADSDAGVRDALVALKFAVGDPGQIFYVYAYPGSQALLDKYRALRFEVLVRGNAPASTNLVFEGAAGAMLGVDAIALPSR